MKFLTPGEDCKIVIETNGLQSKLIIDDEEIEPIHGFEFSHHAGEIAEMSLYFGNSPGVHHTAQPVKIEYDDGSIWSAKDKGEE